ncbi:MAG: 50S ribosomal protein L11 methyltransferase [Castellaniella sp.]
MQELVLICPQASAEALADILFEAGALSVSVEDADGDTPDEVPLYGEPGLEPALPAWRRNRVVALLPAEQDGAALMQAVHDAGLDAELEAEPEWRSLAEQDWVRMTQGQFEPLQIGPRLWIVPSWHRNDPGLQALGRETVRIELDPGLAFGTGSHPTTHLCLEWLQSHPVEGRSVLDYGCGSGVLGIAARLLGSGPVRAVDIDPQAVQATRDNAAANRVALQAMLPDDLDPAGADIVLANILSGPLKVMAPMLSRRVLPGGFLVLSGILDWQAQELIDAYAPWLALEVWRTRDVWVCLHGQQHGQRPAHDDS